MTDRSKESKEQPNARQATGSPPGDGGLNSVNSPSPAGLQSEKDERIRELAVNAVCPINQDPITPFEINMVKTLEEFGHQVLRAFPVSATQRSAPFLPLPWRYVDAGEGVCVTTGRNYGDIMAANERMVAESVYEDDAKAILDALGCLDGGAKREGQ